MNPTIISKWNKPGSRWKEYKNKDGRIEYVRETNNEVLAQAIVIENGKHVTRHISLGAIRVVE